MHSSQLSKTHPSSVKSWRMQLINSTMFALRSRSAGKEHLTGKGCTELTHIFSPHMIHHLDNPLIPWAWFQESTISRQHRRRRYGKIMTRVWDLRSSGEHRHVHRYASYTSNLSTGTAEIGTHQLYVVSRVFTIHPKTLRLFSQCRFWIIKIRWSR